MKRFTLIDYLLVAVIIVGAVVAFFVLKPNDTSVPTEIDFTVSGFNQQTTLCEQIKVGDIVCISNKERDYAEVVEVSIEPAKLVVEDELRGRYWEVVRPEFSDVAVKLKATGKAGELLIESGSTPIRVGAMTPVRGKGYAMTGFITEMSIEDASETLETEVLEAEPIVTEESDSEPSEEE